jgi:hypothetical protein
MPGLAIVGRSSADRRTTSAHQTRALGAQQPPSCVGGLAGPGIAQCPGDATPRQADMRRFDSPVDSFRPTPHPTEVPT